MNERKYNRMDTRTTRQTENMDDLLVAKRNTKKFTLANTVIFELQITMIHNHLNAHIHIK